MFNGQHVTLPNLWYNWNMNKVAGGSQYLVNGETHYQRNKETYYQRVQARKEEIKAYLKKIKEDSGCTDCGITDWRVLDFDHVGTKTIVPSQILNRGWSTERIDKELSQCEIRCANCHRIVTWERRNASLV